MRANSLADERWQADRGAVHEIVAGNRAQIDPVIRAGDHGARFSARRFAACYFNNPEINAISNNRINS